MSETKHYENKQIVRIEGNQRLLELQDHLNKAEKETVVKPLAESSKERLVLVDYSAKEKGNTISVYFNLDKKCLHDLYQMAKARKDFRKEETRIYGEPDANGKCQTKKLTITRQSVDQQGKPKTYAFYICIEEGRGIKAESQQGGFYLKQNSFVCEKKAYINVTQLDFEYLLTEGIDYWKNMEQLIRAEITMKSVISSSCNTLYLAEKKMIESIISVTKQEIIENINNLPL